MPINDEFLLFSNGNKVEIEDRHYVNFLTALSGGISYMRILNDLFDNDVDQFAKCVGYAFSKDDITTEQLTTLLHIRTLTLSALSFEVIDIFDEEENVTAKAESILPHFISPEEKEIFFARLKEKPASERIFFQAKFPESQDERIESFLFLANSLKLLKRETLVKELDREDESSSYHLITTFSAGAQDALTIARFGVHAKTTMPMVGKISIDAIGANMYKGTRPLAVDYPGVPGETSFHNISANPFYLSLHDELHRLLISSIPNPSYYAFLHAIEVVRKAAGIRWSKEIWDSLDMEIGIFLSSHPESRDDLSPQKITEDFFALLNAKIYTEERPSGLFNPSALNDTLWVLLLDLHFNLPQWQEKSIDPSYIRDRSGYQVYYDFIVLNQDELQGRSVAEQVAWIKCKWFNLPFNQNNIHFKKSARYIQLELDGDPLIASKLETYQFLRSPTSEESQLLHYLDTKHNPKKYIPLLKKIYKLMMLINNFPAHKEEIFIDFKQHILSNEDEFNQTIESSFDLKEILDVFPEFYEEFYLYVKQYILSKEDKFKEWAYLYNLSQVVKFFPNHNEEIFTPFKQFILSNADEFKKIINSPYALEIIVEAFPDFNEEIYIAFKQYILSNEEVCEEWADSYIKEVVEVFPNHKGEILAAFNPYIRRDGTQSKMVKKFSNIYTDEIEISNVFYQENGSNYKSTFFAEAYGEDDFDNSLINKYEY